MKFSKFISFISFKYNNYAENNISTNFAPGGSPASPPSICSLYVSIYAVKPIFWSGGLARDCTCIYTHPLPKNAPNSYDQTPPGFGVEQGVRSEAISKETLANGICNKNTGCISPETTGSGEFRCLPNCSPSTEPSPSEGNAGVDVEELARETPQD